MTGAEFYDLIGECPLDIGREVEEVECSCPFCQEANENN